MNQESGDKSASFGEFDLIQAIQSSVRTDPRVPLGIGDDAALIQTTGNTLVAADMLLEGRHFTIESAQPEQIGRKALAVNLSDIAAMAGRPWAAFVTVAHRRALGQEFAERLHAGLSDCAREFAVTIAGGDTNVWDGPVVVGVTLIGECQHGRAVTRSGARPGDHIFITGPVGGSLPSQRHLNFAPRIDLATRLHAAVHLNAMIDVSDGLLADLGHICEESNVQAALHASSIPIHQDVGPSEHAADRLQSAISDGEDFELIFCVSSEDAQRLIGDRQQNWPVHEIGHIREGQGVVLYDDKNLPISINQYGWVHQW